MSDNDTRIAPVQFVNSIHNMVLGFIPGGHVAQEFFEFHGKVRQERINRFTELLKKAFEEIFGAEMDGEKMMTENFVDAFEMIIKKVMTTSSEEKLQRLCNVLVKQTCEPEKYPIHQTYIDLIEGLNDFQILYLDVLDEYGIGTFRYREIINHNMYGVSEDDIEFYIFDLEYRGLIMNKTDIKSNTIKASKKPYIITRRAQYFLQFIEEHK